MNLSMPGLPVHHQLPEFTQTHVHRVSDAIQPSHLCCPLLLLPTIPPSIRVFSNESSLCMRWPKYWSFIFSIISSREHPGLISFRLIGGISLQFKGLSRVFSNNTVQKQQFVCAQTSLWFNSHNHTWLLEKTYLWLYGLLSAYWCLCFLICCLGLSLLFFQGTSIF